MGFIRLAFTASGHVASGSVMRLDWSDSRKLQPAPLLLPTNNVFFFICQYCSFVMRTDITNQSLSVCKVCLK